jgi:hypothetical protein
MAGFGLAAHLDLLFIGLFISYDFLIYFCFLVKVNVKLSLYRHSGAKLGSSYSSNSFLTSTLHGGEWSASRPGRALPQERPLVPTG